MTNTNNKSADNNVNGINNKRDTFADRVARLRTENGLSHADLAELIGCSVSTCYNWEQGKTITGGKNLDKLAEIFGVNKNWLLYGNGFKTNEERKIAIEESKQKKIKSNERVYKVEHKEDLENIQTCINGLPLMYLSDEEAGRIYKTLTKFRDDLEKKVIFGEGGMKLK